MYRILRFFRMFFNRPYHYFVVYYQTLSDGRQQMKNGVVESFDKMDNREGVRLIEKELLKKDDSAELVLISMKRIKGGRKSD